MRCTIISVLMGMIVLVSARSAWCEKGRAPRGKKEDPNAAKIDLAINKVFEAADKNHSGTLSKIEFHKAESLLDATIRELAKSGVIGQRTKPAREHGAPATNVDLSKNNRITPGEFSFYAKRIVDSADEKFSAARLAYEAQQRAAAKSRRAKMAGGVR